MRFERQSGVFLHLTSLPGPHGVGDLGAGAREFIDFLAAAEQSLWQFCPVGPTSSAHGNSPYQAYSAFAGNPILIDLRGLADRGYLDGVPDAPAEATPHEVRYDRVTEFKETHLRTAHERFRADPNDGDEDAFEALCESEAAWLD